MASVSVRFRVELNSACAIGPGKIELIEAVARNGSLSQAARELKMSYRRAWQLLASLNTSFRRPVATLSTGGRGGGGAQLTEFGQRLIDAYRSLEADIEARARPAFAALAAEALDSKRLSSPRPRPLKRRV